MIVKERKGGQKPCDPDRPFPQVLQAEVMIRTIRANEKVRRS